MIMENRSKRLSEPLRWGRREKSVVAVLLSCVLIVLIGLGAYSLTSGSKEPKDCVDITFASTLACGPDACLWRARQDPVRRPTGLQGDRAAAEAGLPPRRLSI